MTTPNIKALQIRVTQIVKNSRTAQEAIATAKTDKMAQEFLREILVEATARAWTKQVRGKIVTVMERHTERTGKMFINTSERYGEQETASIEDYRELNPDGKFSMGLRDRDGVIIDVIMEELDGEFEVIAEAV